MQWVCEKCERRTATLDQFIKSPELSVVLINLGTPAAPTAGAVRAFLREFLSDPRVVRTLMPRWAWRMILEGVILPLRAERVAQKYKSIWTEEGSPLLAISRRQAAAIEKELGVPVELGMRYGEPSIACALAALKSRGCDRIVVFPLFPQSSEATTGTVLEAVSKAMEEGKLKFELRTGIPHYFGEAVYIEALAESVSEHWAARGRPERLLISFHGLPRWYPDAADYFEQCKRTATLVAERLGLKTSEWQLCFQSRYGRSEWLGPYTFDAIKALGREHAERVDVISPGFAADCLETLHELAIEGRELFQSNGGGEYDYIGALNDRPEHVGMMAGFILRAVV